MRPSHSQLPQSYDDFDRRWRSVLLAYFGRRVGNRQEAEDLTQETFVRLLHSEVEPTERTNSYIFTVAANLLRDRARQQRSRPYSTGINIDNMSLDHSYDSADELAPERVLMGKESLEEVINVLAELDERTRNIFILARLEKMKHREIAALYDISVSAVEKQIAKALSHLMFRLGTNVE